jgi:putative acyl-CoA dehydrogenase
MVGEALECLGGNGYVEESLLPRLYRDSPLNSIWEGSGNVIALDVLRAIEHEPDTVDALFAEIDRGCGSDRRFDAYAATMRDQWKSLARDPRQARRLVERLALCLQGSLLVRHSPPAVAEAFCATRLAGEGGVAYGTLPTNADQQAILDRALPH